MFECLGLVPFYHNSGKILEIFYNYKNKIEELLMKVYVNFKDLMDI